MGTSRGKHLFDSPWYVADNGGRKDDGRHRRWWNHFFPSVGGGSAFLSRFKFHFLAVFLGVSFFVSFVVETGAQTCHLPARRKVLSGD